jgi:hypothetical protein
MYKDKLALSDPNRFTKWYYEIQHAILLFPCLLTGRDRLLLGFDSVKSRHIFGASKQVKIQ